VTTSLTASTAAVRVLVVEDEALVAMHITDILNSAGFDVVGPCATVAEALSRLAQPSCCDAAILDAQLRNESALPVAERLAKLDIRFIVATGYNRGQLSGELALAPIIAKPVDAQDLVRQLREITPGAGLETSEGL